MPRRRSVPSSRAGSRSGPSRTSRTSASARPAEDRACSGGTPSPPPRDVGRTDRGGVRRHGRPPGHGQAGPVSLPNGCRSLPVQAVQMPGRFDTIVPWMDSDGPGREGVRDVRPEAGSGEVPRGAPEQEEGTGRGGARKGGGGGAEGRERGAAAGVGPGRAHRGGGESTAREDTPGSPTSGTRFRTRLSTPKSTGVRPMTSLPGFTSLIKGF